MKNIKIIMFLFVVAGILFTALNSSEGINLERLTPQETDTIIVSIPDCTFGLTGVYDEVCAVQDWLEDDCDGFADKVATCNARKMGDECTSHQVEGTKSSSKSVTKDCPAGNCGDTYTETQCKCTNIVDVWCMKCSPDEESEPNCPSNALVTYSTGCKSS